MAKGRNTPAVTGAPVGLNGGEGYLALGILLQRWEHVDKQRYYELQVVQDLFGTMLVQCRWGRIGSRLGGGQQLVVNGETLPVTLSALTRRRQQRGYVCVRGQG